MIQFCCLSSARYSFYLCFSFCPTFNLNSLFQAFLFSPLQLSWKVLFSVLPARTVTVNSADAGSLLLVTGPSGEWGRSNFMPVAMSWRDEPT